MAVLVRAPARLHLGFIPPKEEGASPGSAAVAIDFPHLDMRLEMSEDVHVSGPLSGELFDMAASFLERYAPGKGVDIEVLDSMKRHAGFGSGTRMALSIGMGISELYGLDMDPYEIAEFFGRARNSQAGLETLLHGGFSIVRSGTVSNLRAPEGWSFVIALPESTHDFHGDEERKAMGSMKSGAVSEDLAEMLENAISSGNIEEAGRLLERIDLETGTMFSGVQEGDYSHSMVEELIEAGRKAGAYGAGQSSWGPAVYFLVDGRVSEDVKSSLESLLGEKGSVALSNIASTGISIEVEN